HWEEDSQEEKDIMERDFKSEIERIRGREIDIAFFPVDPRLGKHYYLGGKYFIDNIKPKHFFPLHFGDNFEIIHEFINIPMENNTHIHEISKRNHIVDLI
ncbi:MAG TPA: hypothetical protein VFD79_04635, partial [Tissierellaceae bacterium]|nr:hypothetical protein [Tissierellaceae bacterium]